MLSKEACCYDVPYMNVTVGSYRIPVDEQGSNVKLAYMPVDKQGMNVRVYSS